VYWSGIIVGTLTAIALVLVIGLVGLALGAHLVGPSRLVVDWKTVGWTGLVFNVCGAFFAFVAGGWVASRIAALRDAESAMLHGAIVWLAAVPIIALLAALGGGTAMGSWYAGLDASHPAWSRADQGGLVNPLIDPDTAAKAQTASEIQAARVTRNTALGAAAALLLGLMGSVIGGWMASGEPMVIPRTIRDKPSPHEGLQP
jgi:hypothetical protein